MSSTIYHIDQSTGHDVIRTAEHYIITNGQKKLFNVDIEVYQLNKENFNVGKDKAVFYGIDDHRWLAFVSDYVTDLLPAVTAGMTWYARKKGYLNMEFTINDPRPKPKLRLVR